MNNTANPDYAKGKKVKKEKKAKKEETPEEPAAVEEEAKEDEIDEFVVDEPTEETAVPVEENTEKEDK